MFDLLRDPLIGTDHGRHSLPSLMAALARGEVSTFPALRPHQRPAWHMFLVQLAVLAMNSARMHELPVEESRWCHALRGLTPAFPDDEPWHLVVADRSRPAFMQPPDPGGLKWSEVATPDALDMLITSRNHDVKREIAHEASPQDWIFALVSLQTMEGFGGAGNYGIARMNGGSSSRVLFGLVPARLGTSDIDPSAWWRRDVLRLLEDRSEIAGKALLWLEPWPEGRSLDLEALDPLFVEICRRIRLGEQDARIMAERSTSKAPRIAAKDAKGNTGDPWAPVHVEGKALTLGEHGDWSSRLLVDLLFEPEKRAWIVPLLARPSDAEKAEPMILVAEAFARGNSKTGGFRSRIVPIPKLMVRWLGGKRPREVADGLLADIAAIETALRDGLALVAAEGDREKVSKPHFERTHPARDVYRREADRMFFPELWQRAAARDEDEVTRLRLAFMIKLAEIARREFRDALPSIPCASLMRPRAEVRGRSKLEWKLRETMKQYEQPEVANA